MGADRIVGSGRRIRGVGPHQSVWARPADDADPSTAKMAVNAIDDCAHAIVELDEQGARVLLQQVLDATDVNLVGAARKVVEAQGRHVRVGLGLEPGDEEATPAERAAAIGALAAELAKLEGGA